MSDHQGFGAADVLKELLHARRTAEELGRDVWDFALELGALQAQGLRATDVRGLLYQGLIEHAYEVSREGDSRRHFQHDAGVILRPSSVFILSAAEAAGLSPANGHPAPPPAPPAILKLAPADEKPPGRANEPTSAAGPIWDARAGELTFAGILVKRFRVPAPNQTTILDAFQEDGWLRRIDDPLAPAPEMCSKIRLRDTVKCLNKAHEAERMAFQTDGTGTGAAWRKVGG